MLIVTLPAHAATDPCAYAERAAAAGADLLEVRGDLTPDLEPFASALPIVASPRGARLDALVRDGVAWLDLELDELAVEASGARRIASWHGRDGCPSAAELVRIGRGLRASGAVDLVKLAARATSADDLVALDEARRQLAADGPTTVLAMGPFAELDRVRSPWRNASTYAALDVGDEAAPGQLTVAQHRRLASSREPEVFGLVGGPEFCARSASPRIFASLFERHGRHAAYVRFPSTDAERDLAALERLGVRGVSVTAPHKRAAAAYVRARHGTLAPDAQRAGALNTMLFDERPVAHQFDSAGLELASRDLTGRAPVAIVGSGGVVPAVLIAATRLGWTNVKVFARNAAARTGLATRFGIDHAPLEALPTSAPAIVVWTLPVDAPELALPAARDGAAFLDLRYGDETDVARRARESGYATRDGSAMLVHQALAQFAAFTRTEPRSDDAAHLLELVRAR